MTDGVYSRKESRSEQVDYCNPFTLHETKKTRVLAIPFFIHHSNHSELKLKIQTLEKANPPDSWIEVERKTITLSENATRILAEELPKLTKVAEEDSFGDYIVIRVSDGTANLDELNPDEVTEALLTALSQDKIVDHLKGQNLSSKLVEAIKYSVKLEEMKAAVAELKEKLDGGVSLEKEYQAWCEKYPWAFGNQFVINDEIREITPHDSVDMLMPRIMAGYRDIIELKRPDMPVLYHDDSHRNYYFSSEVTRAIGQCHRYLDVFCEVASNGLIDDKSIIAYHPEATIVIGRSKGWSQDQLKALHGLNSRLNGISIITYDHLLAQGECLVDYLSSEMGQDDSDDYPDIPF